MTDDKHNWSLTEERSVLETILINCKNNPKKVKQMATKIYATAKSDETKKLCMDICSASNPLKYIKDSVTKVRDFAILLEQFIGDGCHGAILTGTGGLDVYPIKLDAPEQWLNSKDKWNPEDEQEIMCNAAHNWMKEYNKGYFYGKVVLFPYFGFSGTPRIYELKCTDGNTEGLVKYPGTNYYVAK